LIYVKLNLSPPQKEHFIKNILFGMAPNKKFKKKEDFEKSKF
jgi:hypothetical protein